MNNDTNSMSIKTKLSLVIIIVMIGLLSISAFALYTEKTSLLNDRQVKTRHLVEAAYSIAAYHHDLQTKGVLTEDQAKTAAMNVIKALRYDEKEYFWINDMAAKILTSVASASPSTSSAMISNGRPALATCSKIILR